MFKVFFSFFLFVATLDIEEFGTVKRTLSNPGYALLDSHLYVFSGKSGKDLEKILYDIPCNTLRPFTKRSVSAIRIPRDSERYRCSCVVYGASLIIFGGSGNLSDTMGKVLKYSICLLLIIIIVIYYYYSYLNIYIIN